MVDWFFVLLSIIGLVLVVLDVRSELVYRARIRAINDFRTFEDFERRNAVYGTYGQMLFDFRKWKYEHFFPGLRRAPNG